MGENVRLSEFFTLAEMCRTSATHLDNTPPPGVVSNLAILCGRVLDPIRSKFGPIIVYSGYRSKLVNRFVKGSKNSQHVKGEAADIMPAIVAGGAEDLFDVARWIASSGIDFDQLILEFIPADGRGGWLHVSHCPSGTSRNEILLASRDARGNVVYTRIPANEIPVATEAA